MLLFVLLALLGGVFSEKKYEYKMFEYGHPDSPHPAIHSAAKRSQEKKVVTSNADMAIGTSFVYSYINSHLSANDQSYTENLYLTITNPGASTATVTVTSGFPNFNNQTVVVPPNTSQALNITPIAIQVDYQDLQNNNGTNSFIDTNKSIWVSSTQPVKLVATNQLSDGSGEDKFAVLPICQLGKNYMAVVDESARQPGSFQSTNVITIIATQDGITTVLYYGSATAAALTKGQSLTIVTTYPQSGISITASKSVAVITGAVCGYGYYNVPQIHCSHEALMLYPTVSFDTVYPFYKFKPEDVGELMIYAVNANTSVFFNGDFIVTMPTNLIVLVKVYTGILISASDKIYVVASGTINTKDQGAPFFAHIPGPTMFTGGPVIFATGLVQDETDNMVHFARIETELNNIGSISIDGYFPNGLLYQRMGKSNYYYYDAPITTIIDHKIAAMNPGVTFAVTVYGYGMLRSYAFNPALNLPVNGNC